MRVTWRAFRYWRHGLIHALSGGLWLHHFELQGVQWAHLVSSDRDALLTAGRMLGMPEEWLQYRPIKHPETGRREPAWHWDLRDDRRLQAILLAESPEDR